jgi:hypothetical protein
LKRVSASLLLALMFFSLQTTPCNAQNSCLGIQYASNCQDFVLFGATAEHTLYLNNNTDNDISVTGAVMFADGPDSDAFSITSTFPIQVPAHTQNIALNYNFSPLNATDAVVEAGLSLSLSGDSLICNSAGFKLLGELDQTKIDPKGNNVDPVVRPLSPSDKRTLAIESNGPNGSVEFTFTNNLTVDATVNKVYLVDGTNFTINSVTPVVTPFTVHPGENFSARIQYNATDKLVHYDKFMVDVNHQLMTTTFDLQGINVGTVAAAIASTLPTGVSLTVSPNPSHGKITFALKGIRTSKIELLDLLGKPLAKGTTDSEWMWDASGVAPGSYFARINGETGDGTHFDASRVIKIVK